MLNNLVERIFNLDAFNLYECFDVYGTIEDAKQGIAETIVDDPDAIIEWLSNLINEIDRGEDIGDDNADDVLEIIAAVKEYAGIDD